MENLRYLLSQYNSKTALLFGHRYADKDLNEGYMAGGGYILSQKALRKFGERIIYNHTACHFQGSAEDLELGRCLSNEAIFVDGHDDLNQKRFFPVSIEEHMKAETEVVPWWYTEKEFYNSPQGSTDCCSNTSVNFHYIDPQEMFKIEYLIYKVHPFGLDHQVERLPHKLSLENIIKASDVPSPSKQFKPHRAFHNMDSSEIY